MWAVVITSSALGPFVVHGLRSLKSSLESNAHAHYT